jgi:hypothetical protein
MVYHQLEKLTGRDGVGSGDIDRGVRRLALERCEVGARNVGDVGLEVYYRSAADSQAWAEKSMSDLAPVVAVIKASVKE